MDRKIERRAQTILNASRAIEHGHSLTHLLTHASNQNNKKGLDKTRQDGALCWKQSLKIEFISI